MKIILKLTLNGPLEVVVQDWGEKGQGRVGGGGGGELCLSVAGVTRGIFLSPNTHHFVIYLI